MKTKITHVATAKKAALRGIPDSSGLILAFPIPNGAWKKYFVYGEMAAHQITECLGKVFPEYDFESASVTKMEF